uniref:Tfp pilus assembly protein PilF n=1 Tax=Desulfovibrio sp. U5L TaxID=596152 RepID=I2Q345_9BACT
MQSVTREKGKAKTRISTGMMVVTMALVLALASCREQSRTDSMAEAAKLVAEGNAKGAVVIYKNLLEGNPEDREARFELAKTYFELGKPDQSAREAEQLAVLADPPAGIHLLLGKALVAQAKTEEALQELSAHLAQDPDSAEAWEYVGHAHARTKHLDEAAEAYEHSLALDRKRTGVWIELVATRVLQNQIPEAQAQVEALLAANPDNQGGLHLLAQIQTMNNDMDAALATYRTLNAKYPTDIKSRYNEAFILLVTQGASEQVAQTAKNLATDYPNLPEGYKLLGLMDLTRGTAAQAVTNFERALRLRPESETHFFLAQAYERNGSLEMAISELRQVLDASPRHLKARQMLANMNLKMGRTDEAIDELQRVLTYHPDSYADKLLLGDLYLSRKDFTKSLAFYEAIPDGVEQSATAHLKKGLIFGDTGKPEKAEAELRQTIGQSPEFLEARIALVALYKQQRRLDEAASVLDAPGLSQPDVAQANTIRAAIFLQQGRTDEAVALLEKAKKLSPKLATPYYTLAKFYSQRMEPEKAMDQYRQLLVQQPQSPSAHTALAAALEAEGKFDEAQQHLEQATASKQADAYLRLAGFLARRNKIDLAEQALGQCLKENSRSVPALVSLSRLQLAAGDETKSLATLRDVAAIDQKAAITERLRREMAANRWDQAEAEAAKFIELAPGAADGYITLASVKLQRQDVPGAESLLRQALEVEPASIGARLDLGALLMRAGKVEEACRHFDEAIAKSPKPAEAYAARGMAWQAAGKTDAAVRDYEAAIGLQTNLPVVLNNLSMIYAEKPALAGKGLEYAMAANALVENNPFILDTLGYALLKNGRRNDAAAVLKRAAALAPQSKDIAKHLEMASSDSK